MTETPPDDVEATEAVDQEPEAVDQEPEAAPDAAAEADGRDSEEIREASPEEVAEVAAEFVEGLVEAMGIEASVGTRIEDGRTLVDVSGDKLGVLIGRRGQTLEALQEVTRTAVQRRLRARVLLLVDVEGYRSRRRASLEEYAKAMATRAKERGTEIELEAMNSYERKIVHDAVAEVDGASSFSEGEEPDRKVIVRGE